MPSASTAMTAIDPIPAAFDFEGREVRTVILDGEPHFMLNDVCAALGIENPRNVAARIDQDAVRKTDTIDSMGRTQSANAADVFRDVTKNPGHGSHQP